MELIDRVDERRVLDGVLRDVRAGQSRVLVLHGEAGIGKSALMEYVAERAEGFRLFRATGVESEVELAYAALHQVCAPMLGRLGNLPAPQRDALSSAFGMSAGQAPDRLVIGLAVLSLFCDVADEQPVLCLIDDLQWLDHASVQALSFVARRRGAEPTGMVFASRVPATDLPTLPQVQLKGLREADARALLDSVLTAGLDEQVRDRFVAETRGNPLALVELPRRFGARELAGGFGLPGAAPLTAAVEESFRREVQALPEQTGRLLLLAAAEPLGDPTLLWRAAATLDIGTDAATPAAEAGLAQFGTRVRFRHPLVRSAIYQSAPTRQRQLAHQALATATDQDIDPDRRVWHRAQATEGPDADVADELERSAGRARARGGLAAVAAFLERSTMLTIDPGLRAERALAAASANLEAGAFDAALSLLAIAEGGPLSDHQSARLDLIRAQHAYVTGRGSDAPPLLLKAAGRFESINAAMSRTTYLHALQAAVFAGRLAVGGGVLEVARAAKTSPRPSAPTLADLLLDGFVANFTDGYAAGVPTLTRAVSAARRDPLHEQQQFLWLAGIAALHLWDDESWDAVSRRHLELGRSAGALAELPLALSSRAVMLTLAGELAAAGALHHELKTVTEATGDSLATDPAMSLAAFCGNQVEASALIEATARGVVRRGEGMWLSVAEWAEAVLNNGIGKFQAAVASALRAAEQPDLALSAWSTIELIEAAARSGAFDVAAGAVARLCEMTGASGTDWALGVEARSRALISDAADAERLYREAIERLGRTRIRTELARTHLLYGEWLRRERRRTDARAQLRTAHGMFDAMGMEAFAERAHRELLATGETARKRAASPSGPQLTPQEQQVARLAAEGLTNPEIGVRLFISAKTVQYHLSKVFTKLGISSRSQLH
ncbi:LuxR family transcriptional regulator [Mycobacterium sp. 852002-10029_SCH5224772]|uniref:helix-turn-helix transcriptional regulator n=1 Tax=Mycobacterium sp. 852002-10029_SCH5224772 TaxID=1834083 RepID=UPI0009EDFC71|nr:LuxR family transcriptional regulator [Mycobacterium sp. 852002-10029_SCH5224772]